MSAVKWNGGSTQQLIFRCPVFLVFHASVLLQQVLILLLLTHMYSSAPAQLNISCLLLGFLIPGQAAEQIDLALLATSLQVVFCSGSTPERKWTGKEQFI